MLFGFIRLALAFLVSINFKSNICDASNSSGTETKIYKLFPSSKDGIYSPV